MNKKQKKVYHNDSLESTSELLNIAHHVIFQYIIMTRWSQLQNLAERDAAVNRNIS